MIELEDAPKVPMFGVPLQPLGFGCGCCEGGGGGCTPLTGGGCGCTPLTGGGALVAPDGDVGGGALVAPDSGVSVDVFVASGVRDGNISGVSVAVIISAGVDVGVAAPIRIVIGAQAARPMPAQRVSAIKFQRDNFLKPISSSRGE